MDFNRAKMIARDLMNHAGLVDWRLEYHRTRRGAVRITGKSSSVLKIISLNIDHVLEHSEEDIIETILHEIGHAMCPKRGHGKEWAYRVAGLGGNPRRLYVEETR